MESISAEPSKKRVNALTSIRGVAALWVLGLHLYDSYPERLPFLKVFANGGLGVDLFFVLSGFILSHVYFSLFCRSSFGARQYISYLVTRFLRIYPLHLLCLAAVAALLSLPGFDEPYASYYFTLETLLANLLLVQNWGFTHTGWNSVSWSISAEWFMYLIFPLLIAGWHKYLGTHCPAHMLVLVLGAHWLACALLGLDGSGGLSAGGMVRVFFEFTLGILTYLSIDTLKNLMGPRRNLFAWTNVLGLVIGYMMQPAWPLFVFSAALLIAHLYLFQSAISRLLSLPVFIWLGTISFSLYMWHWIVIQVFNYARRSGLIVPTSTLDFFVIAISITVVSILVAWASFNTIEKYSHLLGHRVGRSIRESYEDRNTRAPA